MLEIHGANGFAFTSTSVDGPYIWVVWIVI